MPGKFAQLFNQLRGRSPFAGDIAPTRVPLFLLTSGRPTWPFPHPWNYREPIDILETYFWRADEEVGPGRHTRYLDVPGFRPVLVTRDPALIKAISLTTGDQPGQFDRDTLPSSGIARATGKDTLLYANGPKWKAQKKLVAPPFARGTLFQIDRFHDFEATCRRTAAQRMEAVRAAVLKHGEPLRVELEPEIKALMLEMLVVNFFGADIEYERIRNRYVPALDTVIAHIVTDTVATRSGCPIHRLPALTAGLAKAKDAKQVFEELVDVVLKPRASGVAAWGQFKSDASDDALRSNIRVFLAGALEATTSFACWTLAHLARHANVQDDLHASIRDVNDFTPENLGAAKALEHVLDETLRLSPALYFHPRRASADTWVETDAKQRLFIPKGTHILLDVWHANRHEDHWGINVTGFPAADFVPRRWERLAAQGRESRGLLHFGFGHGPRFCPGKNLGQLEVALTVAAVVKMFRFRAVHPHGEVRAGVSTKPRDGLLVDLWIR